MDSGNQLPAHGDVLDIGGSKMDDNVTQRLIGALTAQVGPETKPTLPDELLYDDVGLPIWNDIIFTPEFYQTHDEIALFNEHGAEVVSRLEPGVTMIDLGAGDTRKVEHLLDAFEKASVPSTYLALDISKASLEQNVDYLVRRHGHADATVTCAGIWGTFEDGMQYVQSIRTPRLFLSLGSVLCNDPWPEALAHLKYWAGTLRSNDLLLVGMDAHMLPKDEEKIWAAYHSRNDLYKQFFLNGFGHANRLVGEDWFCKDDWEFDAVLEKEPTTRHRFFFKAKRDISIKKLNCVIKKGQEIDWFDSHKYAERDVRLMCSKAGLSVITVWQAPGSEFRQYLLKTKSARDEGDDGDSAVSGVM